MCECVKESGNIIGHVSELCLRIIVACTDSNDTIIFFGLGYL